MPEPTFESEAAMLWENFVTYTNDPEHTLAQVIAAEAVYDAAYETLMVKFSHPPGRPNRRR